MKRYIIACALACTLLTGCAQQNHFNSGNSGGSSTVAFGTVLAVRQVPVAGTASGKGARAGAAVGRVAGSFLGTGSGMNAGTAAGNALGNDMEQNAGNRIGIEYIIAMENGRNQAVVQDASADDRILQQGERVMVETKGAYHRVLPADTVPSLTQAPVLPVSRTPKAVYDPFSGQ